MRKLYFVAVLVIGFSATAFSQGLDLDVFLRTSFGDAFITTEYNDFAERTSSSGIENILLSSRVGVGVSYEKEFSALLMPGIKAQAGFFPLANSIKEKIILFDFGARIFNGFTFGSVEAQPFFGVSVYTASANSVSRNATRMELGLELIVKPIGIEYAYIMSGKEVVVPEFGAMPADLLIAPAPSYHRIGFSWHIRTR